LLARPDARRLREHVHQTLLEIAGLPAGPRSEGGRPRGGSARDVRAALEGRFVRELRQRNQDALTTVELLGLREIKGDKDAAAARLVAAGQIPS